MREALFVKQNSSKWEKYEKLHTQNPDEMASQFISITDDLAFAKTFYPKSKTTAYLNGLASRYHQSIYRNKKEKSNRFFLFWKSELPLLFKNHQKPLLYSLLFFLTFSAIGALSAKYDDTFVRLILGDGYVNMTNDNIEKGDPFGVYKKHDSLTMFIYIAMNNIYVSFTMFVLGCLLSVGTLYALLRNGIMLGAFQYYFFSHGLGWQSILVIWIHGTLEISAIVIAGAAGLVLGNSILFPKTFTRVESLKRGAKEGTKIIIGLVPIFLCAAFLEGYITRHTEMPVWLSISILAASFIFIIWYVVIYPNLIYQKTNPNLNEREH
ncbi:stage II sporulation protein M [Paradesertivirga mongoliensis]|uniref:Stage II sporulation protein M n=1 Tax=Paradesertivirga mongoliensis TaxID=2100740 RepID=A0ABW4ZHG9_9SPHI|nr:stage II sporulation protein M [Pedobacter mongoliensis]